MKFKIAGFFKDGKKTNTNLAAIHIGTGPFIAFFAGWVIHRLKLEGHVEDWMTHINSPAISLEEEKLDWNERHPYGRVSL